MNVFLITSSAAGQRCQYERKLAMSSTLRQQLSDLRCGPMLAFRALCKSTRRQQSFFQRRLLERREWIVPCAAASSRGARCWADQLAMGCKTQSLRFWQCGGAICFFPWTPELIRRPTALQGPLKEVIGRGAALEIRMPHQLERSGCGTRGICIKAKNKL